MMALSLIPRSCPQGCRYHFPLLRLLREGHSVQPCQASGGRGHRDLLDLWHLWLWRAAADTRTHGGRRQDKTPRGLSTKDVHDISRKSRLRTRYVDGFLPAFPMYIYKGIAQILGLPSLHGWDDPGLVENSFRHI